jgi:putative ABC transport system permease protein
MLLKVAWLNIWRNRTRSLVVIGAIIIGVWAVIFLMGYMYGVVKSYVNNAIQNEISHIQIHHPDFPQDKEVKFFMDGASSLQADLESLEYVEAATVRTMSNCMISTSKGARGIQVKGVVPEKEASVTKINEKIIDGEFLGGDRKNQIIISKTMAEKLKVKLRSKVVLTFQDMDQEIVAGAFRIVGLFETHSNIIDEGIIYVQQKDINRLLNKENIAHEAAIFLSDPDHLDTTMAQLQQKYPDYLIQSYKEISPEIELFNSQIQVSAYIFTFIVMLALIFGIINTMLMAVLERIKELGMLMAIGMNKVRVFFLIVIETLLLGIISAPIGLLLGYLTINWLSEAGIDLSAWSQGMREFGMSDIIYPSLDSNMYGQLAMAVFITAILAAIYPAIKAIQLRPDEALRKI